MTEPAPVPPPGPDPVTVERVYRAVQAGAMADVPILNPALEVAAVGFRPWQGYQLGVLLTPWFMNLMLFPGANPAWPGLRVGESRTFTFPAGSFEFLLGEQDELGRLLACSLFSPVFEFEDQAAAVATAEAVMAALFEPAEAGEGAPAASTAPATPMSRREFLRGRPGPDGPAAPP